MVLTAVSVPKSSTSIIFFRPSMPFFYRVGLLYIFCLSIIKVKKKTNYFQSTKTLNDDQYTLEITFCIPTIDILGK